MKRQPAVGLVVAGAGARGAYEAGALSVLIPRMVADSAVPTVLVGTSAGALNVAALAATAEQGWGAAAAGLAGLWESVDFDQVAGVPGSLIGDVWSYARQVTGLRGHMSSLLDTTRLRATLSRLLPMDQLHDNIRCGPVDAVAVATTSTASGATVVFVEKKNSVPLPPHDTARNIYYVQTTLTVNHILASAAVPVAFRPVLVPDAGGWYVDGGVRLNTPLKPALKMGCRKLGVVATHPLAWPATEPLPGGCPDVFRSTSLALQSLLADGMVQDLRMLAKVNALLAETGAATHDTIPFLFAGPPPSDAHALGTLANTVFSRRTGMLDRLRHRDTWLLNRALGGAADDHGELLSFLLFDPRFTTAAAALGAAHARAGLPRQHGPDRAAWPTTIDHALTPMKPHRHPATLSMT